MWDINTSQKVFSFLFQASDPRDIQITDDFRVVLPLKKRDDTIIIVSKGRQTHLIVPKIKAASTRVIGNQIAAHTNKAFFVWNTDGKRKWTHPFPDDLKLTHRIACSQKYYLGQLGGYSTSNPFGITLFKERASIFVANLEECTGSICQLDSTFDHQRKVKALSVFEDTLYLAYREYTEMSILRIQSINLLNMQKLAAYSCEPSLGEISTMISTSSQLVWELFTGSVYRLDVLNLNTGDFKELRFEKSCCTKERSGTFFNSDDNYLCADGYIQELSSIPDDFKFQVLDRCNRFSEGIFISIKGMPGEPDYSISIKDYNPSHLQPFSLI